MDTQWNSDCIDEFFNTMKPGDTQSNNKRIDEYYSTMKQRDPNGFALNLALLVGSPPNGCREVYALFMRRLLTDEPDLRTWRNLPVSTRSTIKGILLDRIIHEKLIFIARQLVITVSRLAPYSLMAGDNNDDSWHELLTCLYECVITTTNSSSHNYAKVSAFAIFANLAEKIGESIVNSMKDLLHPVFRDTLNDDTLSLEVRAAAMCAAINFILFVSSSNDKARFQDLLPGMMKILTEAASNTDEEELIIGKDAPLEYLLQLAQRDPRILRTQLKDVVFTILEIVEADCLREKTRELGVLFLITLVEEKVRVAGMLKKLPLFIDKCFAMLLNLLVLGIKDDPTWHSSETFNDETGTTSTFRLGRIALQRVSLALGGYSIAHVAKEQLCAYLDAPGWKKRHAALSALVYIAEALSTAMIKNLEQVENMVLGCIQDPHPRVRWAACVAIRGLVYEFKPQREEYLNQVYLALSAAMDDLHPQVQASAMSALGIFCQFNKPETLIPHLDGIVNKWLVLIQNEKQMVQEQALKALGATAKSVEGHFETYYDTVMPHLRTVLRNADPKSNHTFRAGAVECISTIGKAVGKEKFRDDGKQIMEELMPLLQAKADDPNTWHMLRACTSIFECMEQELLPYMNAVISSLIQYESDEDAGVVLAEEATACNILRLCAEILEEDFYPWIPQVVPILVRVMKFSNNNHARKSAVHAMSTMLRCAKLAVEKGIAQGGNESYFTEWSDCVILALVDALHKENGGDLCVTMLDQLNKCLQICGPLLHEGQVRSIMDEIKHVIKHCSIRKQERTERTKKEDFHYEEADVVRDLEQLLFHHIGQILQTLINGFKAVFLPFLDELSSYYLLPMMPKEKTTDSEKLTKVTLLRIYNELIMEFPEVVVKYSDVCLPFILDASNDEDPHVRQCALYGLGLWAGYGRSSFKRFVGEALSRINVVIMHFKARDPENEFSYDSAVFALGMLCQFHGESMNLHQVVPAWLNCLPIKVNLGDAQDVHEMVCSMVERFQEVLFVPNNQYIPRIVSVFTEVVCCERKLAREETANRMINLLRHLQQTVPAALELQMKYLLPHEEMELKYILSLYDDVVLEQSKI